MQRREIRRQLAILLMAAIAWCAPLHAIERSYFIDHVTPDDELAQNTVNAILQDSTGLIWVGTQGGLHRYDGYEFSLLMRDPERANGLPESLVTALGESDLAQMWVGFRAHGVRRFDRTKTQFIAPKPVDEKFNLLNMGEVRAFFPLDGGKVLVGSERGLDLVDSKDRIQSIWRPQLRMDVGGVFDFSDLKEDRFVYAASHEGVLQIERKTNAVEIIKAWPDAALSVKKLGRTLYIGAVDGLWALDLVQQKRQRVWPLLATDLGAHVTDLCADKLGRIWASLPNQGLLVFDTYSKTSETIATQNGVRGALPENTVRSLYLDRSGMLWIGGDFRGLSYLDTSGTKFKLLRDELGKGSVDENNVRSIYGDERGELWVGTEGDGLKTYSFIKQEFTEQNEYIEKSLRKNGASLPKRWRVLGMAADAQDNLWLATNLGAHRIEMSSRIVSSLPLGEKSINDSVLRSIAVLRDGTVWMGTNSQGLIRYDPRVQSYDYFKYEQNVKQGLWHNNVLALKEDREGRLWIGSFDGVNLYEPKTGLLRRLSAQEQKESDPTRDAVRVIHESQDGKIWLGTHSGLIRIDEIVNDTLKITKYSQRDGLANQTVYGILESPRDVFWLSTNRGISRIDVNLKKVQNFAQRDGLQGYEFNGGSFARLADGRFAFGGSSGINIFDPREVSESKFDPQIVFTAYRIGDVQKTIEAPETFKTLLVAPKESTVSLEFASLDFASPKQNRFQYRLDGLHQSWQGLDNRHQITFTDLAPGNYNLRVRGSNRDQIFGTHEAELKLKIAALWWQTSFAKFAFAALLIALLFWALWLQRRRYLRERQYRRDLQLREERFRLALWGNSDEFWVWDLARDKILRLGADRLLGFEHQQEISGAQWREKGVHPEDLPLVVRRIEDHLSGKLDYYESEHRIRNAKNEWTWVITRGKVVERDEHGVALKLAGTARDITATLQIDRERRIAGEVVRCMSEAVSVSDLDFNFISVNPAFCELTGYQVKEIIGRDAALLNGHQHSPEYFHQIRRELILHGHWHGEVWQRRKNGEEFLCALELSEVRDSRGDRTHWIAMFTDVTDRKRAEQELRYLANYDTLTSLPNRTLLGERLSHALLRARRLGTKVAVLFLDLDRFKHVNDSLGHAAGDRLLKSAAQRLRANVRESDTVARLGGDEFTVVLEDLMSITDAEIIARKLIEAFENSLEIDRGQEITITPSIGISIFPDHGQVPTDLLKYADTAMYSAKDRGRNTYQTYNAHMDALAQRRALMINLLRRAAERDELKVEYQPKMRLVDKTIVGFEALLRWHSPALGLVSPTQFIGLAEEAGLIGPIGEWVLREACHQIVRFNRTGRVEMSVAVNISSLQLSREDFAFTVSKILRETGAPTHQLELELTESVVMSNAEQTTTALTRIRALGVTLAIDDFGTGYSSLSYLKRLPIDTLKIDKTFVRDIIEDPDDAAITKTVIMMAHAMSLKVVAEGVETQAQLDYLQAQNCDMVQGFLVSHPLPAEECIDFITQHEAKYSKA